MSSIGVEGQILASFYDTNSQEPSSVPTSEGGEALTSLYDALDQEPSSVRIHELLLEVWRERGNENMSAGIASTLIMIDPNNVIARRLLNGRVERMPGKTSDARHLGSEKTQQDFRHGEASLKEGYTSLKLEAQLLGEEIAAVHELGGILPDSEVITNLQAIRDGHVSRVAPIPRIVSVREVARTIMKTPGRCQELMVEDFGSLVRWATSQHPPLDPDAIRARLLKRKTLLEAALPESMKQSSVGALMHIEREQLQKKYVNSETMYGDKIEDIPKQNFFVSEDNYAWDMEELARAIEANKGVMRNPLSKQLFSMSDIRIILAHPIGQRLKPLQRAQSHLKKGVRPETIKKIAELGRVMLAEQSIDAAPSREAMDEFLSYVETIPEEEQKAINSLKIPARDSFSGQPFDYTIGESVGDAKANTTCFHKVGDFLSQAATYLQQQ